MENAKKGVSPVYRARGMIVGCAGAGKTTLLKRIQKKDITDVKSTTGLDVYTDLFRVDENQRKLEGL